MNGARQIQWMKVTDIIPYENNPRDNADAVGPTADSIKEFGFNQPIAVDENRVIICGHTRLMAAKLLGMEEVPVIVADWLTPEQAKAYRIADNKTGEKSTWNITRLVQEQHDLEAAGFDLAKTGFNVDEWEKMMAENDPVAEGETDPDDVPEVEDEPRSVAEAVYRLGSHRIMCGDSLNINHIRKLVGDRQVDLWLTDPPYNVDYTGGNGLKIKNDKMSKEAFSQFLHTAFKNAYEVMRKGAPYYIWHSDSEGIAFREALLDADLKIHQLIIWTKTKFVLGRLDYQSMHEPCLYGWKEGEKHTWISNRKQTSVIGIPNQPFTKMADGRYSLKVDGRIYTIDADAVCTEEITDCMAFDKPWRSADHPTMKPTALLVYLIKNSSYRNAWVLDNFLGSGSTLIACEQTGRNCLGMEYDPHYCDVIRRRYAEFMSGEGCDWEALTPRIE